MATGTMRVASEQQQSKEKSNSISIDLRLTDEQEEYLERQFQKSKNPHPSELMLTAAETGLLEDEVQKVTEQEFRKGLVQAEDGHVEKGSGSKSSQ